VVRPRERSGPGSGPAAGAPGPAATTMDRACHDGSVHSSNRIVRYGAPVVTVLVGVVFAAVETNSLGNTVSLVLIAGGLIWLMATLGREMGMTANTGRPPRVPKLPPEEDGGERRNGRDGH
jgi:hypothetical protein